MNIQTCKFVELVNRIRILKQYVHTVKGIRNILIKEYSDEDIYLAYKASCIME